MRCVNMKKYFIFIFFILFILISSVSASEINGNGSDIYLSNDFDESIQIIDDNGNIEEDDLSSGSDIVLNSQCTNESLSSSDLIVNSDFEDGVDGWAFSGSSEVVADPLGQYGSLLLIMIEFIKVLIGLILRVLVIVIIFLIVLWVC